MTKRERLEDSLEVLIDALGTPELEVLQVLADRLLEGQNKFGPMTDCKKPWCKEAFEEFLDASIYCAKGAIERGR